MCSSWAACTDYGAWVDARAKYIGAIFKENDTTAVIDYEWLGVQYNHAKNSYRMSTRFIDKIPGTLPLQSYFCYYETLCARLVYASGILSINMPKYYWTIKYTRRQVSKMNKGLIGEMNMTQPPEGALRQLHTWAHEVRSNEWQQYHEPSFQAATMYTDASLDGWGAVLFLPDGTVYGTGAAWAKKTKINEGEALAIERALYAFQKHWDQMLKIYIHIDNTSVHYALRKQWAESEAIARVLARLLEVAATQRMTLIPRYVTTKENCADPWSRNRFDTWRKGGIYELIQSRTGERAGADGPLVSNNASLTDRENEHAYTNKGQYLKL